MNSSPAFTTFIRRSHRLLLPLRRRPKEPRIVLYIHVIAQTRGRPLSCPPLSLRVADFECASFRRLQRRLHKRLSCRSSRRFAVRPRGRTYCTDAVVFSAAWHTVTCNDDIIRKSITEVTSGNTLGWHELIANTTRTCFAIASNSSHKLFGPCLLRGSLNVAHFGGPTSDSKSPT
jgi:hypothetical protein